MDNLKLPGKGYHLRVRSASPEATMLIGERLGQVLKPGDVVCLYGELGAGKTIFIKGLARGLGVGQQERVRSPTFALIHQYRGRIPLYHFDLFRLGRAEELLELGYKEFFYGDGAVAIEWAEKGLECLPESRIDLLMKIAGQMERELAFHFPIEDRYLKFIGEIDLVSRG